MLHTRHPELVRVSTAAMRRFVDLMTDMILPSTSSALYMTAVMPDPSRGPGACLVMSCTVTTRCDEERRGSPWQKGGPPAPDIESLCHEIDARLAPGCDTVPFVGSISLFLWDGRLCDAQVSGTVRRRVRSEPAEDHQLALAA